MTDRPDSDSTDDSPEIAEVRRLLAESRHTDPMPPDVAARLDDVLLDLSAQRSPETLETPETPAPLPAVVPIAAHRRRRAAGLLVAAAAIVVGGVVLAQDVHLSSSGDSSASVAEDAPRTDRLDAGQDAHAQPGKPTAEPPQSREAPTNGTASLVVRPRHFADDALRGRRQLARIPASDSARKATCVDVPAHSRVVAAKYRHAPAALVYRRPQGNTQVVELFICGGNRPIRSTTLSVP